MPPSVLGERPALVLAAVLLAVICVFAMAFFSNPVSKALTTRTAKGRLAEQYPT